MIYIDVDNVIADFEGWLQLKNKNIITDKSLFSSIINTHYNECFRDSKLMSNSSTFLAIYKNNKDVKFLSSICSSYFNSLEKIEIAKYNKIEWLLKLGIHRDDIILVDNILDKLDYCEFSYTLFDDNKNIVDLWIRAGGVGILVR